jgi:MFS family permease
MVCRVGLGIVEAMYGPGVPLYLSYFYPREKLGLRTGIFISGAALANAYGGALAYGIAQAKASIAPWRILFIVEGVPTCLLAVLAWYAIPDSPTNAYFLKGRDREIAIELSLCQPGDRETKGLQWKQVWGSLLDYRSEHLGLDPSQSVSLTSSARLLTRVDVLRVQRLLRVSAPFCPHYYI